MPAVITEYNQTKQSVQSSISCNRGLYKDMMLWSFPFSHIKLKQTESSTTTY